MDFKKNDNQYFSKPKEIEKKSSEEPAGLENEDVLRFEIDTNPTLEYMYNSWLGRSKINGVWTDDSNKIKLMNKELADKLITDLKAKINPQALISQYPDDNFINDVAWKTAKAWNKSLRFTLKKYELKTEDYTILTTITIPYLIKQLLYTGYKGFNAQLRAERGRITINKSESSNNNTGGLV